MAGAPNSRKFPTLTEIVQPMAMPAHTDPVAGEPQNSPAPRGSLPLEGDALAQAVIRQIGPQLELELRRSAHALLDVQLTALLPELHQRIEEIVRQAIIAGGQPEQP